MAALIPIFIYTYIYTYIHVASLAQDCVRAALGSLPDIRILSLFVLPNAVR